MLTAHHAVAFLVLAATWGAAALTGLAYYRRREPRGLVTHLLALAQTLLIAQVGLGLLLLSDHRRAPHHHGGSYHWHAHIWPKLFTNAGFERGTGVLINITPPELAAQELRRAATPLAQARA